MVDEREDQQPELTPEEKEELETLSSFFQHPGWQVYRMAAEETLFTLMQAYFNFSLKETIDGKQRFKGNEQLVIEQIYLRGRIDQLKDMLYNYQEGIQTAEQTDRHREGIWERTKALFIRLLW